MNKATTAIAAATVAILLAFTSVAAAGPCTNEKLNRDAFELVLAWLAHACGPDGRASTAYCAEAVPKAIDELEAAKWEVFWCEFLHGLANPGADDPTHDTDLDFDVGACYPPIW